MSHLTRISSTAGLVVLLLAAAAALLAVRTPTAGTGAARAAGMCPSMYYWDAMSEACVQTAADVRLPIVQ